MPLWPLPTATKRRAVSRSATSVAYTNVVSGGTAHTKGNWAQITASAPIDVKYLFLRGNTTAATGAATPFLMDIGVGAAGSELVVFPNLDCGFTPGNWSAIVPVDIPAGTRIAARMQGLTTGTTFQVVFDMIGEVDIAGGPAGVAQWVAYGADTANSRGTAVTPGNSGAWGSWTQLGTTSTEHDYWIARADMGANSNTTAINYRCQLAFAVNATEATACVTSGTHLELPQAFAVTTSEVLNQYHFDFDPDYAPAPAGIGIWCRAAASGTAQTIYVAAYGGK